MGFEALSDTAEDLRGDFFAESKTVKRDIFPTHRTALGIGCVTGKVQDLVILVGRWCNVAETDYAVFIDPFVDFCRQAAATDHQTKANPF